MVEKVFHHKPPASASTSSNESSEEEGSASALNPSACEWTAFFVRPDDAECWIDLMLPDGRVVAGVHYRGRRIADEALAQLDFCGWRYTPRQPRVCHEPTTVRTYWGLAGLVTAVLLIALVSTRPDVRAVGRIRGFQTDRQFQHAIEIVDGICQMAPSAERDQALARFAEKFPTLEANCALADARAIAL
jgi:hypothetical protein